MLNVSLNKLPENLDPTNLRFMEHFLLVQLYSQTLVRVDETGSIISYLAKRWSYEEKTTSFTFNINDEALFSDGSRLTCEDVAWSLSRHFWESSNSVVANYLGIALLENRIKDNSIHPSFICLSDTKLQIKLKKYYSPLLFVLTMPGFSVTKKYKKFIPIGSGPLKLLDQKAFTFISNGYFKEKIKLQEIKLIEKSSTNEAIDAFNSSEIDLSLGLNLVDFKENRFIKENIHPIYSESLASAHLYFNTDGIYKLQENRKRLFLMFSEVADVFTNKTEYFERLKTFIPDGLLPKKYYKGIKAELVNVSYKSPISAKIVLNKSIFSEDFSLIAQKIAKKYNITINIILSDSTEFLRHMKNKDFDLIGGRYVGNYPDPDAFIDSINKFSNLYYGNFETGLFFKQLEKYRFEKIETTRLKMYAQEFLDFEANLYIIPLFRLKIPILVRKELSLPNTKFRYEGELWKIFWK
ncbi:MAG: ABC transporter substrate-binding protein [Pseudobdellovibrionaceae bacterium]